MMKRFACIGATLAVTALVGCDDATGPGDDPPVLPDVESMEFDVDFFETNDAPAGIQAQTGPGLNWVAAALHVTAANVAVIVHTTVPVATWRAARAQVPTFEDGQWHWTFSTQIGQGTYGGDLTAYRDDTDRVFEMRIDSSLLGLEDFLWYTGRAPVGGTMGEWQFFDPEAPSTMVGRIEWAHPENDEWVLTFFADSGNNEGDELEYHVDGTARSVSYFDASTEETAEVVWDALTFEGHIMAPGYNQGVRACWDGDLQDVECPS